MWTEDNYVCMHKIQDSVSLKFRSSFFSTRYISFQSFSEMAPRNVPKNDIEVSTIHKAISMQSLTDGRSG